MSFIDDDTLEQIPEMSSDELDELDFGVVKVDETGVVEEYNHYESEMAGVDPETAIDQNFFTDVAPCTNNQLFYGQFQDGMEKGQLDMEMDYTFTYKMKPTNVKIRLFKDEESDTNWVFVKKKD